PPSKQVSSASLVKAADQTRDSGSLGAAALLYQRAEQLDPKDLDPPLQLGKIWAQLGDPRQAAASYQRALSIDPKNVTALRGLANAELQLGDLQRSEERRVGKKWRSELVSRRQRKRKNGLC